MRSELIVKLLGVYHYEKTPFCGYGVEYHNIYKMSDDNNIYVWDTTTDMTVDVPYTGREGHHYHTDRKGNPIERVVVNSGACLKIRCTIIGDNDYKGEKQVKVNRVKVVELICNGKSEDEIEEERRKKDEDILNSQMASLNEGDQVLSMTYANYKKHYSDCEKVRGSFTVINGVARISVIVRKGRMVNSGVRGKSFRSYTICFKLESVPHKANFRAVSYENAVKQCRKLYPKCEVYKKA